MSYISKKQILSLLESGCDVGKDILRISGITEEKCALCGNPFLRKEGRTKYCEKCRDITYDRKVSGDKKDKRTEYKKMYARKMRGKITEEEFNAWKENN